MPHFVTMRILVAVVLLGFTGPLRAEDAGPTLATIRVPEGFSVERVAAGPLVDHPLMAAFDDRGRLFVADNAGLNLPADELLKQLPNMVRMLEDTDGDGRFDRATLFADKMTFPQGAAWYRGALYVASPPSIWRLEDTDDDGVADRREEIVSKFGFIGNAADIHGCFVTPSGRIAWCDGRHGHELKASEGQTPSKGLAARIFSCRPDGSQVEVFCGGGMDNPVEVTFSSAGDTFGTMTFYNPDDARHDALVQFVYGGVYPRKHFCTSEFKRTGDFMPALSRFGVTAPSGLMMYAGAAWGNEFRDNLFSAQFNTHKILRHVLTRQGAAYRAADEDFLVSTSADFHPTDVLEDADGSLLVIDTGGWFRIGCPTSQTAKPQIGGAIYRIRRAVTPPADPRGMDMDWSRISDTEMADILGDPRPAVAERAVEVLALRGDAAMGSLATALFENTDFRARQNGVWALARNGSDSARQLLRQALDDDEAPVRQAAAHAVSDLRDADSLPRLVAMLSDDDLAVRREVAAALGRLGQKAAVPALLAALEKPSDRFVEHAVIFALIEINDRASTLAGIAHSSARVRRGALVALDQMDDGRLTSDLVAELLATDDPALLAAVVDVVIRHPDWSATLEGLVNQWLALAEPSPEQLAMARGALAAFAPREATQTVMAKAVAAPQTAKEVRLMLLELMSRAEFETVGDRWSKAVADCLAASDSDVLEQAILAAEALKLRELTAQLVELGLETSQPSAVRVAAWHAASQTKLSLPPAGFTFLTEVLADATQPALRRTAAEALGSFALSEDQRALLPQYIERLGPLEISWLLRVFESGGSSDSGLAVVTALTKSPALSSLSGQRVRETFANYPPEVRAAAEKLAERSSPDERARAAQLAALAKELADGEAAKGEDVFYGARAACSACHRIGHRGEKIGPDLSKIGEVRTRADLVEAIVFPSASLARGFESFQVLTKAGKIHGGLLSRETAAAIYLRTTDRAEIRIDRDDLDELTPSRTSIMPQGLEQVLSRRELADLISFLQSLK